MATKPEGEATETGEGGQGEQATDRISPGVFCKKCLGDSEEHHRPLASLEQNALE